MAFIRPLFRFAAVGAAGTLVQYFVLWFGVNVIFVAAATSSGIGFIFGSIVNYLLNYRYTFNSKKSHTDAASKYYTILGVGWCINTGTVWLLTDKFGLNYWLAQFTATGIAFVWHFYGSKVWAFKVVPS